MKGGVPVLSEELSKREYEVLAELSDGRRVSSIAERLFISPHTVRNHLRNIFWKLGVHSQAELVDYVKQYPDVLAGAGRSDSGQADDFEALLQRYTEANEQVSAELDAIFDRHWGPNGLREMVRVVLPLDEQGQRAWQARLELWSRERRDPKLAERRSAEIAPWRHRMRERIADAQASGWIRDDQSAEEILEGLYGMIVGSALQLLKDYSPVAETVQLRLVEAFVHDIVVEDQRASRARPS
jgi:DNA-binding CsgD family transcriptional regulator